MLCLDVGSGLILCMLIVYGIILTIDAIYLVF
jgi:hypothetical protein